MKQHKTPVPLANSHEDVHTAVRISSSVFGALLLLLLSSFPFPVTAGQSPFRIPAAVAERLSAGHAQDLIVQFDNNDVEAEAAAMRNNARMIHDNDAVRTMKRTRYRSLKQFAFSDLNPEDTEELRDFDQLPMSFVRVKNRAALDRLLADPRIQAVYEDLPVYPHLAYSLPFIGQPTAAGTGFAGSGTTVAVIDTGINYTLSAFGNCTAPGIPAGCRVVDSVDVTGHNLTLNSDPKGHGTNVAGIVAAVAPGTLVAAINVFSAGTSSTSWVLAGINWAIANQSTYNIVALNMSLGDSTKYTSPCSSSQTNPYVSAIGNLRSAGILPVASSGNSAFTNGISSPACTPGVVSVGAVYDLAWRSSPDAAVPFSFTACTETSLAAVDKIPCFSNSASYLTMLAPGAFVTAAGIQFAGTSQAAPHVAGAVAALRASYPSETVDQIVTRLTSNGVPVSDTRSGTIITKPRLNLSAAIGAPANNMFAQRTVLAGDSGHIMAHNLNTTKEASEPLHAGNAGGKSVWWSWSPSKSGVAVIDTHGSGFNTLLSVYGGSSLANLTQIADNDNDGSTGNNSGLIFAAQAGSEYFIAVDGYNGESGTVVINWDLMQRADLGIVMTHTPTTPFEGDLLTYTLTVTNYGPSAADNVVVTGGLPAGVEIISASSGCSLSGNIASFSVGTIASSTSVSFQVQVISPFSGELISTAQVNSSVSDPQPANNSSSASLTVSQISAVPAISPFGGILIIMCLAVLTGSRDRKRCNRIDANY